VVPEGLEGTLEIRADAKDDALRLDNRAWATLRGLRPIQVVVASDHPRFVETIGGWLNACPRMTWQAVSPGAAAMPAAGILITDQPTLTGAGPASVLTYATGERSGAPRLSHWVASSRHPITRYLRPLEPVATVLDERPASPGAGEPILWGLAGGRRLPLVSVVSRDGRREVHAHLDPTDSSTSVPVVLLFLNALRWLIGAQELTTTGAPLAS